LTISPGIHWCFLRGDRLPLPIAIKQDICESNPHHDPPVLIADHIEASRHRYVLIKVDLHVLKPLRIRKRLAKTRKYLPFIPQLAFPIRIHEIIGQDSVESYSVAHDQCAQPIVFDTKNGTFIAVLDRYFATERERREYGQCNRDPAEHTSSSFHKDVRFSN